MEVVVRQELDSLQRTRRGILETLKSTGKATVEELAEAVGLSPITIRHHLNVLLERGLISTEKRRGGPGRPRYLYRLTQAAEELFPKTYHLLADRLLEEMVQISDRKTVAQALRGAAQRLMGDAPQKLAGLPIEKRMEALSDLLDKEGFWARWAEGQRQGEYLLHEQECPYYYVASRHPVVCSLDLAIIREMSGGQVRRGEYRLQGDTVCSYHIQAMQKELAKSDN
ncbi:MAG: winged helix-turn-helix transcriptional regulator [Chloroflexi bacterium]|nr:winged helix-turn-helix transcriptional regulator [Chloroflexota bacterium]